jgi:hypothetical protein
MNESNPLDKRITVFKTLTDTASPIVATLGQVVQQVANPKKYSLTIIERIRSGEATKDEKKQLPIICFSGVFRTRDDASLEEHSGLMVIDIDDVNAVEAKRHIALDKHTLVCFVSPSGRGIKVVVRISNPERHRDHYRSIIKYYDINYGLEVDPTGINVSRACFFSYDPEIVYREDAEPYGGLLSERAEAQQIEVKTAGITDYEQLNIACRMIRRAEQGEKHDVLLRASVLCGGYIAASLMEEDEVVRVLAREISKRDVDSMQVAMNTIRDGLERGKLMPIKNVLDERDKMRRELLISDGDMSFISSDDDDYKWISMFARGEIPQGLSTGIEKVDAHWRFKKNFMVINGHSNIGKTTFALYLQVASSMKHGWKWLLYTSENKTASVKMKLMTFAMGKTIESMTKAELKLSYDWVRAHFTIIENNKTYSFYDLLVFTEKVLRQERLDGVLIDPYNGLKRDMRQGSTLGVHEYDYEAISEMLTMANANGIAVWLNAHAVTEAQRMKGPDGLPIAPFAEQTEGGGKFVNRADDFVTFHRKIQHPDAALRRTVEMHVRKIRETETGGSPTSLDNPLMFECNFDRNTFYFNDGSLMFSPLACGELSETLFR